MNNRDGNETIPKTVEPVNPDNSRSVFVIKSRLGHLWNKKFIARKFAFWNMLKNYNKAEIYEKWLNSTPLILPRKLQIKPITDEPEQQRRLRERMSLDKMSTEIELLKLRGSTNEEKYKAIDNEMFEEFSKKSEGLLLENIKKLWMEECEKEELNSLQRWEKSDIWFNNYESEFSRKYSTENPFMKKLTQKTYADVTRETRRNTIYNNDNSYKRRNQNPRPRNMREQNTYNGEHLNRNRERISNPRYSRNNSPYNSSRIPQNRPRPNLRQQCFNDHQFNTQKRQLNNQNDNIMYNRVNRSDNDRFLDLRERYQDTRWNQVTRKRQR